MTAKTRADADLIARYLTLTKETLPNAARQNRTGWNVSEDHCFQRIVLDTICGGVWYDHVQKPAYRNLTQDQAQRAVSLCEDIIAGRTDLNALNHKSLIWRGKRRAGMREIRHYRVRS